jgi:hypothetical protein
MQRLSESQLLDLWEKAYGKAPSERAVMLVGACQPDVPAKQLLQMTVGQREGILLRLREQIFGSRVDMIADCPSCKESLEFSFHIHDILCDQETSTGTCELQLDGHRIAFRVPNNGDLIAVQSLAADERRRELFNRCTQVSHIDCDESEPQQLSPSQIASIINEMAVADPQANIQFEMTCAACSHRFTAAYDAAAFLWRELHVWAQRLLLQIHSLALRYGWTEEQILGLSSWRRQVYTNLARQ